MRNTFISVFISFACGAVLFYGRVRHHRPTVKRELSRQYGRTSVESTFFPTTSMTERPLRAHTGVFIVTKENIDTPEIQKLIDHTTSMD